MGDTFPPDVAQSIKDLGSCREILAQQSAVIHELTCEVMKLRKEITDMFADLNLGTGQETA